MTSPARHLHRYAFWAEARLRRTKYRRNKRDTVERAMEGVSPGELLNVVTVAAHAIDDDFISRAYGNLPRALGVQAETARTTAERMIRNLT